MSTKKEKKENPLRKYLDETGLTLSQFSKISGVSVTCVHQISTDANLPSRRIMMKIKKATGGRVDFDLN